MGLSAQGDAQGLSAQGLKLERSRCLVADCWFWLGLTRIGFGLGYLSGVWLVSNKFKLSSQALGSHDWFASSLGMFERILGSKSGCLHCYFGEFR